MEIVWSNASSLSRNDGSLLRMIGRWRSMNSVIVSVLGFCLIVLIMFCGSILVVCGGGVMVWMLVKYFAIGSHAW